MDGMTKETTKLKPKQARALACLLAGGTIAEAADAGKINRSTVYKWLESGVFQAEIKKATIEATNQLSRGLITLGGAAVKTLEGIINDQRQPASLRLRAADIIISRILDVKELLEFEDRLAALEAAIAEEQAQNNQGRYYNRPHVDYRDAIKDLSPERQP
mgnify:CR=1 FL=1